MALELRDFLFIPMNALTEPPKRGGMFAVQENSWWAARRIDGTLHLAFYKGHAPQCNDNELITRKLAERQPWDVEVVFVPRAYLRDRDFRRLSTRRSGAR